MSIVFLINVPDVRMLEEPLCEVGVGVGQPQQLVGQHREVLLAVGHPAQARVAGVLHYRNLDSG